MQMLIALVAGALFGAGLTVAQMVDPAKVQGFLDVGGIPAGTWDPTLLMVFIGALPVMFLGYVIQRGMSRPVAAPSFQIPTRTDVDGALVGGAALFGVGWGLAGICPGPALAVTVLAGPAIGKLAIFIASMLAGIGLAIAMRRTSSVAGASAARHASTVS
jgi:hypothetical protein